MAISVPTRLARRNDRIFYCGMSAVAAALVFAGFSRTYYLSSYFNGPSLTPLRHVHGAIFTAWVMLFMVQTWLVAADRTDLHRKLGVFGAMLAAAMVVVGTILSIDNARAGRSAPGVPPLAFLAMVLFDMVVFSTLVAMGVYFRRRPETHKRLMLLATLNLLAAAVARLPTALAAAGPPFYFGVVDLLVLTAVGYDLVTRRKVHPAYVWGGLWIVGSQLLRLVLSGTPAWLAFARQITR
jgi:hypothetical protein